MRPLRRIVTVSKPRCGCWGNPGTISPWYIRHPSFPSKSWPMFRPASEAAGPSRSFPRRVGVVVVDAEEERIGRFPHEGERLHGKDGIGHTSG
jgi:hypothetical protein